MALEIIQKGELKKLCSGKKRQYNTLRLIKFIIIVLQVLFNSYSQFI